MMQRGAGLKSNLFLNLLILSAAAGLLYLIGATGYVMLNLVLDCV